MANKSQLYFILRPSDSFPGYGGAPPEVVETSEGGSAASVSRSDHTHGHGKQPLGDGTNHAEVSDTFAGFMSPADKVKLDALGQPVLRTLYWPLPGVNPFSDYRVFNLSNGASTQITFGVPSDFISLEDLDLVFIPNGTQTGRVINFFSDYAADGEDSGHHSGSSSATQDFVGGVVTPIDCSAAFPALAAGDVAGLTVQNTNAVQMSILYLRMRYLATH